MSLYTLELNMKTTDTPFCKGLKNRVSSFKTFSLTTTMVTGLVYRNGDRYRVLRYFYMFTPTTGRVGHESTVGLQVG